MPGLQADIPPDLPFELALRRNHLEQLRNVRIPLDGIPGVPGVPGQPWPLPPGSPTLFELLKEWSKKAKEQIKNAVEMQAVSSNDINWEIEVFTVLESAAVYLRDTGKVRDAVLAAQESNDEMALQHLKNSQYEIKRIAAMWGLRFEVVCDLLKHSPDGHPFLNGPYAGLFFTGGDTMKPFLGLSFKGTYVKDWKAILVDLKFAMQNATHNILWNSPIHRGFYDTMFLNFKSIKSVPFDYIKHMIDLYLNTYKISDGNPVYLHSTGHSLGAAYATLCHAELVRLYNNDPTVPGTPEDDNNRRLTEFFSQLKERKFIVRDLYTFGCPRVGGVMGGQDWADHYLRALDNHDGQSWRVVNKYDPVAAVPPVIPFFSTWNHIDNGYEVSKTGPNIRLPSEVGTQPGVSLKFWNYPYHSVAHYYQSLYNASAGRGNEIVIDWIEEVPPENEWDAMEAEARALLGDSND